MLCRSDLYLTGSNFRPWLQAWQWTLLASCLACCVAAGQSDTAVPPASLPASQVTQPMDGLELRPCSFKNVTPGQSSAADVLQQLGPAVEETEANGQRSLIYHLEPFQLVEVIVVDGVVASVILHFSSPAPPTQIERELQLQEIEAAPVFSETGQLLGRVYPERGVLLSFDPESKAHRAAQLILEPITAEPFVLRVRNDSRHRYEKNIADLEIARRLDPTDPDTLQLLGETFAKSGQIKRAMETIDQALELVPGNARLTLEQSELLARLDRSEQALDKAKGVVADRPEDPELQARGEKLLGDLLALGPARDFARAIEHHLAAIKLAAPLASDKRVAQRRAAKELLVSAFLAAAFDIAAGDWQDKDATTEKWLTSARELSDALITQDQGDELCRLQVTLATLAVRAEMSSTQSSESLISAATREIQRLNDVSGDPLFRRELDLLRVRALFDAASIAHHRGQTAQARELAAQGVKVFEPLVDSRELNPSERYLIGRMYFFVGSSSAVAQQDHAAAVKSYAQARKYLSPSPPTSAAMDLGRHGERFVSMGASYFESGERELGVRLTREGLETMKEATDAGIIKETALALPYSNLAAMYKLLGKESESRELSEMASRISSAQGVPQRR